jgi:hypothetical protein
MSIATSPLQSTINAIAKSNRKINGVQIRVTKKASNRSIITGKSILSVETTGAEFYQK